MTDRLLVVEDNASLRIGIVTAFEDGGYDVIPAASGTEAIAALERESIQLVVSDIKLGDLSGVDILKKPKEINSETEVILMTAYATVESAIQALRLGAFDYIQKPFDVEQLKHRVLTASRVQKMRSEIEFFRKLQRLSEVEGGELVAENRAIKEIFSTIRKVAPTPATNLITGESN